MASMTVGADDDCGWDSSVASASGFPAAAGFLSLSAMAPARARLIKFAFGRSGHARGEELLFDSIRVRLEPSSEPSAFWRTHASMP